MDNSISLAIFFANVVTIAVNVTLVSVHLRHVEKEMKYLKKQHYALRDGWEELLGEVKRVRNTGRA